MTISIAHRQTATFWGSHAGKTISPLSSGVALSATPSLHAPDPMHVAAGDQHAAALCVPAPVWAMQTPQAWQLSKVDLVLSTGNVLCCMCVVEYCWEQRTLRV
jgi:hypothetical protein